MLKEVTDVGHSDASDNQHYQELTARNRHFVLSTTQQKLKKLRVFVAGCGSTGGACTESLARVGVCHFALADSGSYELNNLNRQHAGIEDIGRNKAEFHAQKIRAINPHCLLKVYPEGVTAANVPELVDWCDIVVDAVDVTTSSGIAAKLELHRVAHKQRKPVLTALDLGYCQYGKSFDYRDPSRRALDGNYEEALKAKHPIKALFTIVPISAIPGHCLKLVDDLLKNPDISASQLGCTSDLLASIIVPTMIRFVETGDVVKGWNISLISLAERPWSRLKRVIPELVLRWKVKRLIRSTP